MATETIYLRVDPQVKRKIDKMAKSQGVSVNKMLAAYLKELVKKK